MLLAASAAEASEVSEAFRGEIAALLVGVNLPDGWGATVAFRLSQERPNMPVLFITGPAESDPVLAGGLSAVEFVVTMPVAADKLVAQLERAMASVPRESDPPDRTAPSPVYFPGVPGGP